MAKSEYLNNWQEYIVENEINPEEADFMIKHIAMAEDGIFRFVMNLIM